MLVPALLVLVSLVVFVAMLALKKKSGRGQREARALGGQADAKAGTKFVEENGEVVRRSTRCAYI